MQKQAEEREARTSKEKQAKAGEQQGNVREASTSKEKQGKAWKGKQAQAEANKATCYVSVLVVWPMLVSPLGLCFKAPSQNASRTLPGAILAAFQFRVFLLLAFLRFCLSDSLVWVMSNSLV